MGPISQREYYQMFAYFNNTGDPGLQTRNGNQAPLVKVFSPEQREKRDELRAAAARMKAERETARPEWDAVAAWTASVQGSGDGLPQLGAWKTLGPFQLNDGKRGFRNTLPPTFGPRVRNLTRGSPMPSGRKGNSKGRRRLP